MLLHKKLYKLANLMQKKMKLYYKKKSEGPDLKKGDKIWLLYKKFKSR